MSCSRRVDGPQPVLASSSTQTEQYRDQNCEMMHKSMTPEIPRHTLFVRDRLDPLMRSKDPYLTRNYVQEHSIKCRRMDLYTGRPISPKTGELDKTSELFTRPYPHDAMSRLMEEHRPWEDPDTGVDYTLGRWQPSAGNWWHARRIIYVLDMYLTGSWELFENSNWELF